jgi:hypothetical protein
VQLAFRKRRRAPHLTHACLQATQRPRRLQDEKKRRTKQTT